MIVPDTNLLIYAYDETAREHTKSRLWWEGLLSGTAPVGVPWIVLLAFTRLMTHPQICRNPLSIEEVRKLVDQWFEPAHVFLLNPGARARPVFFDLLDSAGSGGNLSTDALIAVIALEHSAVVHSNDPDFERFPGLRWVNPLR